MNHLNFSTEDPVSPPGIPGLLGGPPPSPGCSLHLHPHTAEGHTSSMPFHAGTSLQLGVCGGTWQALKPRRLFLARV